MKKMCTFNNNYRFGNQKGTNLDVRSTVEHLHRVIATDILWARSKRQATLLLPRQRQNPSHEEMVGRISQGTCGDGAGATIQQRSKPKQDIPCEIQAKMEYA